MVAGKAAAEGGIGSGDSSVGRGQERKQKTPHLVRFYFGASRKPSWFLGSK